eukprot:Plantae.Rhodophyta-Hildenbrandia_rubra.ctg44508.p2 GENE.Plantae.Rhodophyta-Hildenbrandia_rubra.ctg44508~~Plantae.Rhodophyta-Hildenbrandia_rubra.ctg44508.p2  ORF type:complete len:155 (-),score=14.64 Plantae.Rhodophyta-Hildenbrandia_rubra.ctg44508:495-959(-)
MARTWPPQTSKTPRRIPSRLSLLALLTTLLLLPLLIYQTQKTIPVKPPSKKKLGRSGWTLIHTMAAKYPEDPSEEDKVMARGFVMSLTKLYPCKECAKHFDKFVSVVPPELDSREKFLMWTCRAHNEVNKRQRKKEFPCEVKALDDRWGDCGCK